MSSMGPSTGHRAEAATPSSLIERLVTLSADLRNLWAADPLLYFPGWDHPFRALGDLLPEQDLDYCADNPQMVPLLWYPALRAADSAAIDLLDHLPSGHPAAPSMLRRSELSAVYSWAIVTRSALRWIGEVTDGVPLVEVGAGSGYWARQMSRAGMDVVATDAAGATANAFTRGFQYADVRLMSATEAVRAHPDRTLMLVWPPHRDPMAIAALSEYAGDTLIYVGEPRGGLCADDAFFDELRRHWRLEAVSPVNVRWLGHNDRIALYRRHGGPETRKGHRPREAGDPFAECDRSITHRNTARTRAGAGAAGSGRPRSPACTRSTSRSGRA